MAPLGPVPVKRLGDTVYETLAEAIASGQLPEGAKLFEDEIAKQMGVSRTPVREAFRQLAKTGLVDADLYRTPVVRRLTRQDIEEIYALREALEPLALGLAVRNPDRAWLDDLDAKQRAIEEQYALGSAGVAESVHYNEFFHRAFVTASRHERLANIMDPLWIQVLRLSFLSHQLERLPSGRLPRAMAEHRAILEAARDRDVERGETLLRRHVRRGHEDLIASLFSASLQGGTS
ncbi:MAG TPA: GntR family transcriptional regulator [bacterium]|nr:GntR family transcriptional regulator [bacterium]